MSIRFYCGIAETRWNYHPVVPGDYACVSPVKGRSERTKAENVVRVPKGVSVLQDSGAFSDSASGRLTFGAALERQQRHADKYRYVQQIDYRVSYDLLIDEVWTEGNRSKRRWSVAQAEDAVTETVAAAQFLSQHREGLRLVLSAQGVDAPQYLRCVQQLMPLLDTGDMLGLGGWCIIGKLPRVMMPVFEDTVRQVVPFAAREGVRRIHIFGVLYAPALSCLLRACNDYSITLSTDSAGASVKPCFGDWGYAEWRDNSYRRPPVEIRGAERARHVALTIDWLNRFEPRPAQLALFEGV